MKRLLLLPALLFCFISQAQVNLGMSNIITNFPDTVDYGDSVTYTAYVKNYGPDTFAGDIRVHTTSDGTERIDSTLYNTTNFLSGDSLPVNLTEVYDSTFYQLGKNIVVIWPSADNAFTVDSLRDSVYIRDISTIVNAISTLKYLKLYPNPVSDQLFFEKENSNISFKQIRILDQSGRFVKALDFSDIIDLTGISAGIYFLEIISGDLKTVLKVVKTD